MAEAKQASAKDPDKLADKFGAGEVKQAFDEAQEQGFFGQEVDPTPNKEFSLQSGPDSPTAAEQAAALAKKEA